MVRTSAQTRFDAWRSKHCSHLSRHYYDRSIVAAKYLGRVTLGKHSEPSKRGASPLRLIQFLNSRTPTTVETKRHAVIKSHRGDRPIGHCHRV